MSHSLSQGQCCHLQSRGLLYHEDTEVEAATNTRIQVVAAVLYFTALYCTVLHCTVLGCTVLHCIVLQTRFRDLPNSYVCVSAAVRHRNQTNSDL